MSDLALLLFTFAFLVPASMLSVEAALSVSIFEIALGIVARSAFGMQPFPFLRLAAAFAGIALTFLAGAEVDTRLIRTRFKESFLIGITSFLAPFLAVLAYCYGLLGWSWEASEIGAIALATTSLAVVYAVLVETGLTRHTVGKLTMAGCFVTDFFVSLALSTLFVRPNLWTPVFLVVSVALIVGAPRMLPRLFHRYGNRVIEFEAKVLFFLLFLLMVLGEMGNSHAMLPAFVLGLVLAPLFERDQNLQRRMRTICFGFLTPFFFFGSGLRISLATLAASGGLLGTLFAIKIVTKVAAVYPFASRFCSRGAMFLTLLMSTGLTMGTLTATHGLDKGIITEAQFGVLLAAVIASAVVPTVVAQRWFQDELEMAETVDPGSAATSETATGTTIQPDGGVI
ncbi:MAG: cation:proton antiporter [Candidatus Riflebacteria bacterium]|nr:cation:proton antiporter [Candidatus Riflebacteria bacterium]